MASHPKYATREGDTLTIYQRDKPVARFTDQGLASCNGDGTCNLWRFDGLVYLRSAAEDRPKPYVAVMGYNGESDIFLLVEPTGELIWLDGPPLASPDGRYLAIGGVDVYQGSSLTIRDQESASPAMVVDFGLTCETLRWTSNTTLRVRCIHDDGDSHTTIASVSQIDATTWQLQETAELDTKSLKPIAHSTLSLKTIAAKTKPRRLPTPEEKANDDLGDKEIGIERLAP